MENDSIQRLTLAEAARLAGVHMQVVLSWIQRGSLAADRVEGKWAISPSAIDACRRRLAAESGRILGIAGANEPWQRLVKAMVVIEAAVQELREAATEARDRGDVAGAQRIESLLRIRTSAAIDWNAEEGEWSVTISSEELAPA